MNGRDPLDIVEDALRSRARKVTRRGDQIEACCPAHDDNDPSLSVSRGNKRDIVLHCFTGCTADDVMTALGLRWTDLGEQQQPATPKITTTYSYVDLNGEILYRVARYQPKDFRPQHRVGSAWANGYPKGVDRILYNLPAVAAAVASGDPVYVVEGEKDVDAGTAAGIIATTSPGGAQAWAKVARHAADTLTGADVIIVADDDPPGEQYARDVAASLHNKAKSLTITKAAPGLKDLADHLGAGHTVEDLTIIAGTEPGDPPLGDWLNQPAADDETPEPTDWTVTDLGPAWNGDKPEPIATVLARSDGPKVFLPGINYMFGDSGDGKTWVAGIAARQVLADSGHVVWITYEDPNELEIVTRFKLLGVTEHEIGRLHVIVATEPLTTGIDWLADLVTDTGARLVVLDSIGEALAVEGVDEDKDADFGPWARRTLRRLLDLAPDGTAILPIDHATKARDNPFYPSGTKRKRAMVTGLMVSLNVRQPFARDHLGRVQLLAAKDRSGRFRRGEIVAEIAMDATAAPYAVTVEPPPEGTALVSGRRRKADERVIQVLETSSVPLEAAEIHRLVNEQSTRLPGEGELTLGTVKNAMTKLAKRPNIRTKREPTGVGKAFRILYDLDDPPVDHKSDGEAGE